jgi:3-hydroxymyristoyl/3-hydroxydecanoyl-(acyl carrier protein) dehydratase
MSPLRGDIRRFLRVEHRENGFAATLAVDANLRFLPDHFPGQPILPGICLVQAVLLGGADRRGVSDMRLRHLKNLKLTQPLRPGQCVAIDAEMTAASPGEWAIKAKLSTEGRRCAEISLVAMEGDAA